ncbi:PX domain-containing protein ypt35 [Bachmanniomyces sp. S44760]|nr:PX domain-containing protein ypt35 [Bachmanniomyces sp. S44760]
MESADVSPSSARHDAANVKDQTGEASQSQPMSPPYWQHQYRRDSYVSVKNDSDSAPITLEDHTEEPSELSVSLWAKTVSIENHVIISGNVPGISDYVTWICKVETLDGGSLFMRKRYSEFATVRQQLLMTYPNSKGAMPPLPPKSFIYKYRPDFLEKRRAGLAYFLNCVLLNPEFSGSPVLREFLFD